MLRSVVLGSQQARYSSRNINDSHRLFVCRVVFPHPVKKFPSLVNIASEAVMEGTKKGGCAKTTATTSFDTISFVSLNL